MDCYTTAPISLKEALDFHLTPPQMLLFESYKQKEGFLSKKSSSFIAGWQERYFKIRCNRNFLLSYHKKEKLHGEPQGVLHIGKIKGVEKEGDKK